MYEEILHAIAGYVSIVPFAWGCYIYNKSQSTIRYLVILSGVAFTTEVIGIVLSLWSISNHFLFHIYPVFELLLFVLIYRLHLSKPRMKIALLLATIAFFVFTLVNIFYIQRLYDFNTYGRSLESFLLTLIALGYLVLKIQHHEVDESKERPMFWVNASILMYFPLTMVFFLMNNYLYRNFSNSFNNFLWDIHALLSFTQYALFTIAIYTEWKRTKSPALS